jgi:multimeric flavodoxin WrbA
METIRQTMLEVHGFVVGSPVRNSMMTACYKRFYERITYPLGFPLLLEDKYTLAVSSVGYMGGKAVNKRFAGLQDVCHTRLSDFIFCRVGMPTNVQPADLQEQLKRAADKLLSDIRTSRPRGILDRISAAVDRTVMRKLMFEKNPAVYAHVIECWKRKGYM